MAEVSVGYSYLHIDTGGGSPALVGQNCATAYGGVCPLMFQYTSGFNGWKLEPQFNFTRWLGFKAQVSGQYGSVVKATQGGTSVAINRQSAYDSLFGGVITRRAAKYNLFAHALIGFESFSLPKSNITPVSAALFPNLSETNAAFVFGGGCDLRVSKYLAIRPGQFDYQYVSAIAGKHQNDFRYSGGIVVRLGGK